MPVAEIAASLLLLYTSLNLANGQYTPQTYPDPRADPITCKVPLPGLPYSCRGPSNIRSLYHIIKAKYAILRKSFFPMRGGLSWRRSLR